ncbi:unnamed protein product [Cuscuta epithymum]|uniref:Calcium-transporting P-type ATPase N-terminal autoinhibitory domain-containing protein n=1 Tax=Cuscuta epithymum TaxID=186058 RepID=A0AAV0DPM5_9ASTE|nr:unnamed protein product [Cuscuta epithymum]
MTAHGGSHRDLESQITRNISIAEDAFTIDSIKTAPPEKLRRWRKLALVLNASRRFRYTLDLKRIEEERSKLLSKIRSHSQLLPETLHPPAEEEEKFGQLPGDPTLAQHETRASSR